MTHIVSARTRFDARSFSFPIRRIFAALMLLGILWISTSGTLPVMNASGNNSGSSSKAGLKLPF